MPALARGRSISLFTPASSYCDFRIRRLGPSNFALQSGGFSRGILQGGVMRRLLSNSWLALLAIAALAAGPAVAWDRGNLTDYHERRARLVSETSDGVVVLFGYNEADVAASVTTFHQNENLYYLTGWNETNDMLVLLTKA